MNAALREVMQELAGDVRVRLTVAVGEDGVVCHAGRDSDNRTLIAELAQAASTLQDALGAQADSTTMTFDCGVALFLPAGRATVAALGTDAVFLVYVEAVWQRRKAQFVRALAAGQRSAHENAAAEMTLSERATPAQVNPASAAANTNSSAYSSSGGHATATATGRGPDLAALLREVEALFVEYRQRESVPPRRSIQHFAELLAEWHSICEPSVYTFPLLLDSLTQVVTRDPAQKTRFSGQVQSMLVPGGLERRPV